MVLNRILSDEGYTLTETLVALVIFVSVLIPTMTIIGNLLFGRSTGIEHYAFVEAQAAMDHAIAYDVRTDTTLALEHGLTLERRCVQFKDIQSVDICVVRHGNPEHLIASLRRYRRL
jgi:hypothetical protein